MIQAVERRQPEVALLARRGVEAVLPAAVIAAIAAALREAVRQRQRLFCKAGAAVGADEKLAVEQGHGVELL